MKPEEQRIAIAEFVFPKLEWESSYKGEAKDPKRAAWFWDGSGNYGRPLPDYLNDLNTMNEAEKCLQGSQIRDFEIFLIQLLNLPLKNTPYEGPTFPLIHATSTQRAEALLRAIGRWTDEAPH